MKKFAIAMFALLICAVILPSVLASNFEVTVKDVSGLAYAPIAVRLGETVPISVFYSLDENHSDVVVKAELYYGHGKEVVANSDAIDATAGTMYTETFSIKVPTDIDTNSASEDYTLTVSLKDKTSGTLQEVEFPVTVQRANDLLDIQSISASQNAESGKTTLVNVVVQNTGSDKQDNVYVKVSIPELGISSVTERIGDLVAVDEGDNDDTAEAQVALSIPSNTADGVYSMVVTAYNSNTETTKTQSLKIKGVAGTTMDASEVVPQVVSQEIEQGKIANYGIIVGNLADSVQTYSVIVSGTDGWATSAVTPLKVTLNGKDSQIVNVALTANANAMAGQHTFTISVKNGDQVVKQLTMTANVKGAKFAVDAMLISVIVLAVILVILVLILIKSRGTEATEAEESYY